MNVFLIYNRRHLEALRLVSQSWTSHGWTVRLYLPKSQPRPPKRAVLVDSRVVNFGCRPHHADRRISVHGKKGWKLARLVKFPSGKLDDILNCGRQITS